MNKDKIKIHFEEEILELSYIIKDSSYGAKYKYEVYRNDLIWKVGYDTFFDIQSLAFERIFS